MRAQPGKVKNDLNESAYLASDNFKAPLNAIDNLARSLVSELLLYLRIGNETEEYDLINFNQAAMHRVVQTHVNQLHLNFDDCVLNLLKQNFMSVLNAKN